MRDGGEPTYDFLTTGTPADFATDRPPVPRPGDGRRVASSPAGSHEADDRGLLRLLPRARTRRPAATSLEADDGGRTWRILLDLGSGALGALQRYADPLAIDAVFLSHLHADHCLDLCGYYVLRRYHPDGHQPLIPVWGPAGTADRMARAYDLPARPGHARGVRLPAPTTAPSSSARSGSSRSGSPTRSRRTGCASAPTA